MDLKKSKRVLAAVAAVYWVFVVGIFLIAQNQFRYSSVSGDAPNTETVIGEIIDGREIQQNLPAPSDLIDSIAVVSATYGRDNSGTLYVEVLNSAGNILGQVAAPVSAFNNNEYTTIVFDNPLEVVPKEMLTLRFYTENCTIGNAITFYAGNSEQQVEAYQIANEESLGTLCVKINGRNYLSAYIVYWILAVSVFLVLSVYTAICWRNAKLGKANLVVSLLTVYTRYGFLIKQLVSRDFKTKYKRSYLGMAWSILNPLLTMSIQYVVFSTLFKSDIPNYPVYLLAGIVFFSFFSEAISMGMTSITSNAALIKKVYVPKYIYPVSRILSSLINFALALVPLFIVMLVTGTKFRLSILLLIFDIMCYLCFIVGMTLLLTTAMTFFQDTQFLWSIVSMMWQYLTPIFYPETIIPEAILPLYRMNPLYQFIMFARTCIIDGVSPEPMAYVQCLLSAVIVLLLGAYVFKKYQNKFVLYL